LRIIGASSSVPTLAQHTAPQAPESAASDAPRALISIEPPRQSRHFLPARHPSAPFLAHLLATRMQAPQTRARRRAQPEEASAVYRSMTKAVVASRAFATRV
jgi:hypothetical protein